MYVFYAFKCNLKELTTKSVFSARGLRSFGMRMPSSSLRPRVIQWRGDFPSCCVVHATRFLSATFVPPPPYYGSFATDIFQCGGFPFLSFCVGARGRVALLWKPRDTPGTQPPFCDAVVNEESFKEIKGFHENRNQDLRVANWAMKSPSAIYFLRHSTTNPVSNATVVCSVTQLFLPTSSVAWRPKRTAA